MVPSADAGPAGLAAGAMGLEEGAGRMCPGARRDVSPCQHQHFNKASPLRIGLLPWTKGSFLTRVSLAGMTRRKIKGKS